MVPGIDTSGFRPPAFPLPKPPVRGEKAVPPIVRFQQENQRIVREAVGRRAAPLGGLGPHTTHALRTVETRARMRLPGHAGPDASVAAPGRPRPDAPAGPDAAADPRLARMREAFNPEATAERLFQFAMTGYGKKEFAGPDTPELRARFRQTAMAWFDRGFDDARKILGHLPDPIPESIDETHARLAAKFDAWVQAVPSEEAELN